MKKIVILTLFFFNLNLIYSQRSIHSNIGIFGKNNKHDVFYLNSFSSILGGNLIQTTEFKSILIRPFNFNGTIDRKKNIKVEIYPNPVADYLQIKTTCESIFYAVIDMAGKQCLFGNEKNIDVQNLSSGIYIIQISSPNFLIHTEKITIQ